MKNTDCASENSYEIVKAHCDGIHRCSVVAKEETFGDPCYGIYKYLEVRYYCI